MSTATRARRAGMLLAGLAVGATLVALGAWIWFQSAQRQAIRHALRTDLGLPDSAFRLERLGPEGRIAIALRRVALLDSVGDTLIAAPTVRLEFDPTSLAGGGPRIFPRAEVIRPHFRAVERPDGTFNLTEIFAVEAAGQPVRLPGDEPASRPSLLRDVRIINGSGVVITPAAAPEGAASAVVRIDGRWVQRRTVRDIDARLSRVRVGGEQGWRIEIGALSANLGNPDIRIADLRGSLEQLAVGSDNYRFDIEALRTPYSSFAGAGTVRLADAGPQVNARLVARRLDFRDLQGFGAPRIPRSGDAQFVLLADAEPGGRTAWTVRELRVATLGSLATGQATVLTGGSGPPTFRDTRIVLQPLQLATLSRAGLADSLPVAGEVTGTITSTEAVPAARQGDLHLDLLARLRAPGAPAAAPSEIAVTGAVGLTGEGVRLNGVRVEADPLRLATLTALAPDRADLLRGALRGGVTLFGTPGEIRIRNGGLTYAVAGAPASRLDSISADVALQPALRYDFAARAAPLSLAMLAELVPALPFRQASLAGPISVRGGREGFRFDTNLQGVAGGVTLGGSVNLGEVIRFDVAGELEAFRAGAVLASGAPLEGPLSGTISASGTTQDFRFDADLAQAGGTFALGGQVRRPGGAPLVNVGGTVRNFRLGSLIGRPGLLASPVSGTLRVESTRGAPYRLNADLRGVAAAAQLQAWYVPGEVPRYAAAGTISGIALRSVPGFQTAQPLSLAATLDVAGQGTTPETLAGRYEVRIDARGTDRPARTLAALRAVAAEGLLRVDTLLVNLPGGAVPPVHLAAQGSLGLTRPAATPLRFTLATQDLARLAVLLPPAGPLEPAIAGTVSAAGAVVGTLRYPRVSATLRGEGLLYEQYAAQSLEMETRAARGPSGWRGELTVGASQVRAAAAGALREIRLTGTLANGVVSAGASVQRDATTGLSASAVADLSGGDLEEVAIQSFALRLPTSSWRLRQPSRIRWTEEEGLTVDALLLNRTGDVAGAFEIDGRLPPSGVANLRLLGRGIDLGELAALLPSPPQIAGQLSLQAAISGPVESPQLQGEVQVDSLVYKGATTDHLALEFRSGDRRIGIDASGLVAGRQVLSAEAAVPVSLALTGGVPSFELLREDPLRVRLLADSLPLAVAVAAVPGVRDGTGTVNGEIRVAGTPATPEVSGTAALSNGGMSVDALGVRLSEMRGRLSLAEQRIRIDSLVIRSGGGRALIDGTVGVSDPQHPLVYLATSFRDFRVIDRPNVAELVASGQLAVSGALPGAALSGRVVLEQGTIFAPSLSEERELPIIDAGVGALGADTVSTGAAGANAASPLGALRVEGVELVIGDGVWVQNPDARVQIQGDLQVYSTGASGLPRVFGDLQTVRGRYDFRIEQISRAFDVERGTIQFYGTPELNPGLDIVAVNEVRAVGAENANIRILVQITGSLQSPSITLTSDTRPPLPQSELLSYLVFGQPTFQLGGASGTLANQLLLQDLIGGQLTGGLQRELTEFGLRSGLWDYVRVRGSQTQFSEANGNLFASSTSLVTSTFGSTSLEFGKRLVPNVYLTVDLGVRALFGNRQFVLGGALEYQLARTTTLRAAVEPLQRDPFYQIFSPNQPYQVTVEIRRRWEFGGGPDKSAPLPDAPPEQRLPGRETPVPAGEPQP